MSAPGEHRRCWRGCCRCVVSRGVRRLQLAAMDQQAALGRARVIAVGSFLLLGLLLTVGFGLL